MEKSKTFLRAAGILMGATMLTTCVLGGTLAKYSSNATAKGSAKVAKWDIEVGSQKLGSLTSIDMFDTIYDLDGSTPSLLAAGDADEEIRKSLEGNNEVLAPGTWGDVDFTVENKGDVKASINVTLSKNSANNLPLLYSDDGTNWYDDVADLDLTTDLAPDGTAKVAFLWKWAFDSNDDEASATTKSSDTKDTGLGEAANGTPTDMIDVSITANQRD